MKSISVTQFTITRTYTVIEEYNDSYLCERDDGKHEVVEKREVETECVILPSNAVDFPINED